jgi:uncharacterized protein YdiU (UPF0061 family)
MAAGFVHGVLNSDNINVTGESFDYGPWRFTPEWDPDFTAAYFDHYGLYSFGRQPEAIQWDLAQLGGCLSLVTESSALSDLLAGWSDRFEDDLVGAIFWRLGIDPAEVQRDRDLTAAIVRALENSRVSLDKFYFDWFGGVVPSNYGVEFDDVKGLLSEYTARKEREHPYWSDNAPCSMLIEEVESIWSAIAEHDDWNPFETKVAAIRRMGEAMAGA